MDTVEAGQNTVQLTALVPRQRAERERERCYCLPFWYGGEMPYTISVESQVSKRMLLRFGGSPDDDGLVLQWETEKLCHEMYEDFDHESVTSNIPPILQKKRLAKFFLGGFDRLPSSYATLDSSHPWLCFWIVHGLRLLGEPIPAAVKQTTVSVLRACQDVRGGFGGGPGQFPHLASTYAACMALCSLGGDDALSVIDVTGTAAFFGRMRQPNGAFSMSEDGEEDTRAVYCAVAVAVVLNLRMAPLFDYTADWLSECQTYEGGFGALPGTEAHGGYTYCAFAALYLLDKPFICDLDLLTKWLSFRQMRYEGGFQGRTSKLVDSCYSFWQGAVFPLLQQVLASRPDADSSLAKEWIFDCQALQEYVIICCQTPEGGICDKPEKSGDYYHSCYALAGLSIAQHCFLSQSDTILGPESNRVEEVHPAFNLTTDSLLNARHFFKSQQLGKP